MTNSTNYSSDISMKLEEVTSFNYLGANLCKDGTCSAELRTRIASAMARLNRIWRFSTISFASKFTLYKSLFTSVLLWGFGPDIIPSGWLVSKHQLTKSSMAVKHGPCLLPLRKESRPSEPSARGNFSVSPTLSRRPTTGCRARSTSLWAHRNLLWQLSRDGSYMVRACHTPQQLRQNHPSRQLGGWATAWSAEEIMIIIIIITKRICQAPFPLRGGLKAFYNDWQ